MEQTFVDSTRQLILRLGPELLVFLPADRRGWQCRVDDISWCSSAITTRGIREIQLHARNGRVVTLLEFDGIERFYVVLLRRLAERNRFDRVREQMPGQVPLLERVLWLAAQVDPEDTWYSLAVGPDGLAIAAKKGLLLMPSAAPQIEGIAWGDLIAVRLRPGVGRFYTQRGWVEVVAPQLSEGIEPICRGRLATAGPAAPEFRILGIECADSDLALTFSWELARARDEGLLAPREAVIACANGAMQAGTDDTAASSFALSDDYANGDRHNGRSSGPGATKTEWILTDHRIVMMERDRESGELLSASELPLEPLPLLRRRGDRLVLESGQLLTDPQPEEMAVTFISRYRELAATRLQPFAQEPLPLQDRSHRGRQQSGADPFSPVVEAA